MRASTEEDPHSLLQIASQRVSEEVRALNLLQVMEKERIESTGSRRRTVNKWSGAREVIGDPSPWSPLAMDSSNSSSMRDGRRR